MQKLIHISAQSEIFSVFELVPENKAVKTLEKIRDNFTYLNNRHGNKSHLIVKTCVNNPELPFKN